jgi:hypothetical protein
MMTLTDGQQFFIDITLIMFSASSLSGFEQSLLARIRHASAFFTFFYGEIKNVNRRNFISAKWNKLALVLKLLVA